jgi:predicted lipid-binding transport protein (Tim44 family)
MRADQAGGRVSQGLRPLLGVAVTGVVLACFVGLFFAWMIAPLAAILAFYLLYLVSENRRWFASPRSRRRIRERAALLEREARSRRADVAHLDEE